MKRQELNLLDDEKLIWICAEPTVLKIRGKDPAIKSQVIMQLNNGERALFLFQVLYGHANNGIPQFFRQISYLAERLDIWAALKSSMRYFHDTEMLALIEKMETAYNELTEQGKTTIDLDEVERLYSEKIPLTLRQIGSFIRDNPAEFLQLED